MSVDAICNEIETIKEPLNVIIVLDAATTTRGSLNVMENMANVVQRKEDACKPQFLIIHHGHGAQVKQNARDSNLENVIKVIDHSESNFDEELAGVLKEWCVNTGENKKQRNATNKENVIRKVIFDIVKNKAFTPYDVWNTLVKYQNEVDLCWLKSEDDGYNLLQAIIVHNRLPLMLILVHLKLWRNLVRGEVPFESPSSFRGHTAKQIAESKSAKRFRDEVAHHERLVNSLSKFLQACHDGDKDTVAKYLKKQPQVIQDRDSNKNNCFYWAIVSGNYELFICLLNHKADISNTNEAKENLLHVACMLGQSKFIKVLLTRCKLDVTALCSNKRTPLERVAENGDVESMKELLACGVHLTSCILPFAAANGRLLLIKYILEDSARYVDVDSRDNTGRSALMKACETGRMDIFQYTCSRGASISTTDLRKRTALHLAAENGHLEIARVLLTKEADVNAQDCYTGAELCFLIRGKAKGQKAWHYVEVRRNVAHIFLKKTRAGQVDIAHYGVIVKSGWGDDPEKGVVEWVEKIFADRRNRPNSLPDVAPLHMAIYKQHPEVAQMLIEKGADVNLKDEFGLTPLMYCALRNDLQTANLLEEKGANMNAKDNEDKTAMDIAQMNEHTEMENFIGGKKYNALAMNFLDGPINQLLQLLGTDQLEELRHNGKDVRRHNVDVLRDANIDINESLMKIGSGPIMKVSDGDSGYGSATNSRTTSTSDSHGTSGLSSGPIMRATDEQQSDLGYGSSVSSNTSTSASGSYRLAPTTPSNTSVSRSSSSATSDYFSGSSNMENSG